MLRINCDIKQYILIIFYQDRDGISETADNEFKRGVSLAEASALSMLTHTYLE